MEEAHQEHGMHRMKPRTLVIMGIIHFAMMFALMYSRVNVFENIYLNLNQVYMAGIMTAPMLVLEIVLMRSMYDNKKVLSAILVVSVVLFVLFFLFIRQQTAITDKAFLRSMIPHHAGAILVCEEASIEDQEIQDLCEEIIAAQQSEIDQMKRILERLD